MSDGASKVSDDVAAAIAEAMGDQAVTQVADGPDGPTLTMADGSVVTSTVKGSPGQ